MSRQRDEFIVELADAAETLLGNGIADPTATQIAHQYYGGKHVLVSTVNEIQDRLRRVRDVLSERGYQTCPLPNRYYIEFRDIGKKPTTLDEARRCACIGGGTREVGLLFHGEDSALDAVWRAHQEHHGNAGGGKVGSVVDRVSTAVKDGKMTGDDGDQLILGAHGHIRPALVGYVTQRDGAAPQLPSAFAIEAE